MRLFIIIICACLPIFSCKQLQPKGSTKRRQREEVYVNSFKMTYFKKMLLSGFDNSREINTIMELDHSGYSEIVLSMEDYKFIDSIVSLDRAKLTADSLASIGRVAEGAGGKRVFDLVLNKYQSRWLNDVAISRSYQYANEDSDSDLNK